MSTQVQSAVLKVLEDRHSVKQYQAGHQMPKADLEQLLISTSQAPSAWNLQHWKLVVIDDQAQKEKLLPIAYGQKQVVESSVVIAVLGDLEANKNAELVFGPAVEAGHLPKEVKDTLVAQIENVYQYPQVARDEAIRNASLAAMQLMIAAKAMGYDTCPMGGYDAAKFVEAFNVPARYVPVMLISVGLAATPARPSGRLSLDQITVSNTF
ncbi:MULTISPECIES: nitroreductase family protein [Paenibacillus]|uniref:Nitroreductase family protein n=1 Tax=Paenibacillus violae TaxID=3077234 RepID=A0ABU3RIH6_9BACL|nr:MULTISPECIES: nitroreductase family protein [Paenibacillus]MDU0204086.1 nitroreductase family protein [Paenibacillus sp. PFR10]MEC0267436.1 nitroreductase family protein [Paenibacillus anseongense]